jgi:heptosyltransferase I
MDGLFEFADAIGVAHGEPRWDMPLTPADRAFAAGVLGAARPAVVISPCTGQRFRNYRNWRAERYAAVAEHASKAYGARIVLTGAGTALEREYAGTITALLSEPPVDLVGKTSLKQLLAVIERAALVVCPDSGPAHMATAVGTPVVGLYATSNRHRTGPYASQHLVVDKYPEAVRREFGKPVEALRWGERVRDPSAMDLIEVDEVKAKVDHALTARPATGSRSAHGDAAPAQARS